MNHRKPRHRLTTMPQGAAPHGATGRRFSRDRDTASCCRRLPALGGPQPEAGSSVSLCDVFELDDEAEALNFPEPWSKVGNLHGGNSPESVGGHS